MSFFFAFSVEAFLLSSLRSFFMRALFFSICFSVLNSFSSENVKKYLLFVSSIVIIARGRFEFL